MSAFDKAFNTQLLNLLKELQRMYPEDADFAFIKHTVFLATTTMEEKPRKLFTEYIPPFVPYIENRDEKFFLSAKEEEFTEQGKYKSEWSSMLITKIKQMWTEMDADTQHSIWLYLNVLVKLGFRDKQKDLNARK